MTMGNDSHYTRFEPWFGAFPPEFRGELGGVKMSKDKNGWYKFLPIGIFVIAGLVGGILISVFSKDFLHELGFAFVVAAIIGIIIELTFVTQLARHIFEISFGYLLPKEIAGEVKWVYELSLLVEDYRHDFVITPHPQNANKVIMSEKYTHTVRNITNRKQEVFPQTGIQEWFHPEGDSQVTSFTVTHNKKTMSLTNKQIKSDWDGKCIRGVQSSRKFDLAPNDAYTVVADIKEIKYLNDQTYSYFGIAAKNPYVTVKIDNSLGLDYMVTFANRNQGELEDLGNGNYRLSGILLPLQSVRIRWWNIADSGKYSKRLNSDKQETISN